eukprot:6205264-Pleurochrysis_carterae.AAC.1
MVSSQAPADWWRDGDDDGRGDGCRGHFRASGCAQQNRGWSELYVFNIGNCNVRFDEHFIIQVRRATSSLPSQWRAAQRRRRRRRRGYRSTAQRRATAAWCAAPIGSTSSLAAHLMLSRRLRALGHPNPDAFTAGAARASCEQCSALRAAGLASWLEDKYIRQLPRNERSQLRQCAALAEQLSAGKTGSRKHELLGKRVLTWYLDELSPPSRIRTALSKEQYASVCSWLLCIALAYEYSERRVECKEALATANARITEQEDAQHAAAPVVLDTDHPSMLKLASALRIDELPTDPR